MKILEESKRTTEAMELLWKELGATREEVQADPDNQRLRRHLLYDFCVYNEVSLTSLKQGVLCLDQLLRRGCFSSSNIYVIEELHEYYDFSIEREVMTLLAEKNSDVDRSGKLRFRQKFLPKINDIRLTYRTYTRSLRLGEKIDFNSHGWVAFQKVIDCRNRITHASSILDLDVSNTDLDNLAVANDWVLNDVCDMMKAGNERLTIIAELCDKL